ncbi:MULTISPECIES: SDR family NAD(P)-dependent oxidoreductase [unclassified Pseudofrankia]|uniref:SDR family NAD(P)-dependent oxidoreductase n=1 Tax=unclassified Pseudofrankia TaxID=2994372 RepID=UPI0008DA3C8F|nr:MULTISPECIES: SDR family NAD(P)-dependent oxidoreductase [unclassified Pseudofrankia]MDT3445608.1 SDR family NAD(P)-dependent oxidoreductase [Pseudofrankia sp. BMG5.37]OHV63543.1 hypothetical protein BCD48_38120 [Pseudofrankia sp. BMG5.36]
MNDEIRFDGRAVIVTGAGRGLGRSHALLLASRGAQVVVNDLGAALRGGGSSTGPAQSVVTEIEQAGGLAVPHYGDVTTQECGESMVATALEHFGRVDAIICNAGYSKHAPVLDSDIGQLDEMLRVHVHGAFHAIRAAWPTFVAQNCGRVVVTSSSAGLYGGTTRVSYSTAKMGLLGLARGFAIDGAENGINVNVVAPGAATRLSDGMKDEVLREKLRREAPAELVSPVFAWLAHPDCNVSGQFFHATSGRVARVLVGETHGYARRDLSVEDVRDHWADICSEDAGYLHPSSNYEAQNIAMRLIESGALSGS